MLDNPEMLCALSLPATEPTDDGLKWWVGLIVKSSCLELPGYYSSTAR